MTVYYHADDFGIDVSQSRRIIECYYSGCLNSVSLLVNSPHIDECVGLLPADIEWAVHLNFVEGKTLAGVEKVSLLVDKDGRFKLSFSKLLFLSLVRRNEIVKEVAAESKAQIEKACKLMGGNGSVRIDSHRHYHMIPGVFQGMIYACQDLGVKINYIRIPNERIMPYIEKYGFFSKMFAPSDIIKNFVLKLFSWIAKLKLVHAGIKLNVTDVFGVIFSCRMTAQNLDGLVDRFIKKAKKKRRNLEVIFHPGGLKEGEECLDYQYIDFYYDRLREQEAVALKEIKPVNGGQKNE